MATIVVIAVLLLLALLLAFSAGGYLVRVFNRFTNLLNNVKELHWRIGEQTRNRASVDAYTFQVSGQAQRHVREVAGQASGGRFPYGKSRNRTPQVYVDASGWPVSPGVNLMGTGMSAGLAGRGAENLTRIEYISAVRAFNEALATLPEGLIARHVFRFRPWVLRARQ